MYRQPIRNPKSERPIKPRVFDAIIDQGEVYLEVKNQKRTEVIKLCDVLRQIEQAKRAAEENASGKVSTLRGQDDT